MSCSSSTTTASRARPGVDGTIWFRGATAFEYFQDPVKTAESRSERRRLPARVGDVGHVDADGYLYLTDRKTYMIISGGVNIYPQETENLLSTHPAVARRRRDRRARTRTSARRSRRSCSSQTRPRAGPELAHELIDFCRERLAHFKCPRTVDFVAELPRSADRQALQAPAARRVLGRPPDLDRVIRHGSRGSRTIQA